jgi:hypothetical protein
MNKTILLFTLLLSYNNAKSQDYSNYYEQCNTADSLAYVGLHNQALDTLKLTFQSVDYIHSLNIRVAYLLAIKLEKFEDAFDYGKKLLINSGEKGYINTKSVEFKQSIYYNQLTDSADFYLKKFNNRVNQDYINLIDSLYYIDQRIIRKNRSVRGKFDIIKKSLPKNRFELDSSNWLVLSKLIDSLGFPSEQNVGKNAYGKVCIIIHHNLRLKENEDYHPKIFEFIRIGDYLPQSLSFWYEQYQMQVKGRTFFTTWDEDISKINLSRIDINRRTFFLKGINSFDIQNNGRKMNSKW